ncbi:MAG: hypothetical protein K2K12_03255, partial [Clostridia bacterium]|nr:hypothetical protein [Clostridia bacterium]
EHTFLYENLNFDKANMKVNGDIVLDGQFDLYKNWTFSMTFTYEELQNFTLDTIFTNVSGLKAPESGKDAQFMLTEGKCYSRLGTRLTRYDVVPEGQTEFTGTAADDNVLPVEYKTWNNCVKVTVKTYMPLDKVTSRRVEIYIGDGASNEDGTLLFTRESGATYPRLMQLKFTGAKNVVITNISLAEEAYQNEKLLGASKMQQYTKEGSTTEIADEYKGGLLMIGDSLVDYWGVNFGDGSTAAITGSREVYQNLGFKGPVGNLGIGSSTAEGWLNYLASCESYFTQFNPEVVFMLLGCNQIGNEDDKNIAEYDIKVLERLRELYPNAKIVVNSLMPTTTAHSRWSTWNRLAGANVLLKAYAETQENIYYLDVENLFTPDRTQPVSETNAPIREYFASDGLHYKKEAYDIWTREV